MLLFFCLSCHIGRPSFETSLPDLSWQDSSVVSRQWEIQLERAIEKNIARENLDRDSTPSIVTIIELQETLIMDDPISGQIWSVSMKVQVDDFPSFQVEDRYSIERTQLAVADMNRQVCYQHLAEAAARRVILMYKYGNANED